MGAPVCFICPREVDLVHMFGCLIVDMSGVHGSSVCSCVGLLKNEKRKKGSDTKPTIKELIA